MYFHMYNLYIIYAHTNITMQIYDDNKACKLKTKMKSHAAEINSTNIVRYHT